MDVNFHLSAHGSMKLNGPQGHVWKWWWCLKNGYKVHSGRVLSSSMLLVHQQEPLLHVLAEWWLPEERWWESAEQGSVGRKEEWVGEAVGGVDPAGMVCVGSYPLWHFM